MAQKLCKLAHFTRFKKDADKKTGHFDAEITGTTQKKIQFRHNFDTIALYHKKYETQVLYLRNIFFISCFSHCDRLRGKA